MKNLKLFGTALTAILLCLNFSACSNDDETKPNGQGGNKTEKKLVKLGINGDIEDHRYNFSYDENNRLTDIVHEVSFYNKPYEFDGVAKIHWYDDSIKYTYAGTEWSETATFVLKNGLIRESRTTNSYGTESYSYVYDSSNRISTIGDDYSCFWDKDKITRVEGFFSYENLQFQYDNKTCKGYFPLYYDLWIENSNEIFYAHPELISLRNNNLPWQVDRNNKISIWTYSLDEDGYVKSCRGSDGNSYSFEWE